jgi:hypothetical protein
MFFLIYQKGKYIHISNSLTLGTPNPEGLQVLSPSCWGRGGEGILPNQVLRYGEVHWKAMKQIKGPQCDITSALMSQELGKDRRRELKVLTT